jgi:hypothetical protein
MAGWRWSQNRACSSGGGKGLRRRQKDRIDLLQDSWETKVPLHLLRPLYTQGPGIVLGCGTWMRWSISVPPPEEGRVSYPRCKAIYTGTYRKDHAGRGITGAGRSTAAREDVASEVGIWSSSAIWSSAKLPI